MKHARTGGEFHTPNYWLIPTETRHLALREMAYVHIQCIHSSV